MNIADRECVVKATESSTTVVSREIYSFNTDELTVPNLLPILTDQWVSLPGNTGWVTVFIAVGEGSCMPDKKPKH